MTVLQLIILVVAVGSFAIGRYSGYHDGYVKGRIAVRKHYEGLLARDQKMMETYQHKLIKAWDSK
jgi:hypothetical protein